MESLTETVHDGMDGLLRLKDTQRALVATISNGQMVVQSIHALQATELDGASPVAAVLAQVHKQGKAMLVLDAEQETLLSSVPENRRQEMRSAICVPVVGEADKLLGLLYADSRARAGNFSYGDLNALQEKAQQLAPRMAALLAQQALGKPKASEEPVVTQNQLLAVVGLVMAAVLWFVLGVFFSRPPAPPPPTTGTETASPPSVVGGFLGALSMGEYSQLPNIFSKRLNAQWPPDKLKAQLDRWKAETQNLSDLPYRQVRPGTGVAVGAEAQVIVDTNEVLEVYDPGRRAGAPARKREPRNYWTFKLVKENNSWKIDSMQAAPERFEPPPQVQSNRFPAGRNPNAYTRIVAPLPEQAPSSSP